MNSSFCVVFCLSLCSARQSQSEGEGRDQWLATVFFFFLLLLWYGVRQTHTHTDGETGCRSAAGVGDRCYSVFHLTAATDDPDAVQVTVTGAGTV